MEVQILHDWDGNYDLFFFKTTSIRKQQKIKAAILKTGWYN